MLKSQIAKRPLRLCHFFRKAVYLVISCRHPRRGQFRVATVLATKRGFRRLFASPMATRRPARGPRRSATVQFAGAQLRQLSPCLATLWQQ